MNSHQKIGFVNQMTSRRDQRSKKIVFTIWVRLLSSINNFLFCAETKSRNTASNPPEVDVTVLTNGELIAPGFIFGFLRYGKIGCWA